MEHFVIILMDGANVFQDFKELSAKNNVLMVNGAMLVATFANVKMKGRVIQLMALAPVKVIQ